MIEIMYKFIMISFIKMKRFIPTIAVFVPLVLLLSCKAGNENFVIPGDIGIAENKLSFTPPSPMKDPKPRDERCVGMSISEGAIGFDKAFVLARSVGVEATEIPVHWDEAEPERGRYVDQWLGIANAFYPRHGMKISISINPIDTNSLRLPKYLKDKPLDDAEMIARFKLFVDFTASLVPDSDIFFVAIGNEIDAYLGNSAKRWQEYTTFYAAVAPYVREKFPKAMIGSKITYDGIVKLNDMVQHLNKYSDIVLTTYYPFKQGSFLARTPATVHSDFKQIVELYPDKKVYFAEIGYPSGATNGSSEEKQTEFIRETFTAWDTYRDKIPYLNFVWLHDISPESVTVHEKYYGFKDKGFASYLGTLGLRTYEGRDKQAFIVLREEIKKRSW